MALSFIKNGTSDIELIIKGLDLICDNSSKIPLVALEQLLDRYEIITIEGKICKISLYANNHTKGEKDDNN